jgi:hypothetical protein
MAKKQATDKQLRHCAAGKRPVGVKASFVVVKKRRRKIPKHAPAKAGI